MNGDEITNLNLERFEEMHVKKKAVATIAISPMRSPFGILDLDGDDIVGFKEKTLLDNTYVSIGVYMFKHEIVRYLPEYGSIERTAFPELAKRHLLKAWKLASKELWLTINSVKDLSVAEKQFASIWRP